MSELVDRLHPRWYRDVAQMVLDRPTFGWIAAGSRADGGSPSADENAFDRWRLVPRVLVDVATVHTAVTTAAGRLALPVLAGPIGLLKTVHDDGEIGMCAGLDDVGGATVVAASTTTPVEEIAAAVPGATLWLQLANWADRRSTAALVDRAETAGYGAVVPLVNAPVAAAHVAPEVGFRLPPGVALAHVPDQPGSDPSLDFGYLEWLTARTSLPLFAKGVMHPDDARRAVEAGARGIVVSNHGGRQLPRAVGTLTALPAIAAAVGPEVDVVLDGGVRTGTDVLVALALGARAVFVGRPLAYALAVGGRVGVRRAVSMLREELTEAASLCGVADLSRLPAGLAVMASAGQDFVLPDLQGHSQLH